MELVYIAKLNHHRPNWMNRINVKNIICSKFKVGKRIGNFHKLFIALLNKKCLKPNKMIRLGIFRSKSTWFSWEWKGKVGKFQIHLNLFNNATHLSCYCLTTFMIYLQAVLDLNPDQYNLYEGVSSEDVLDEFEAHRSSWSFLSLVNMRRKDISLNPFNTTCVGIQTHKDYKIHLQVTRKFNKIIIYIDVLNFTFG